MKFNIYLPGQTELLDASRLQAEHQMPACKDRNVGCFRTHLSSQTQLPLPLEKLGVAQNLSEIFTSLLNMSKPPFFSPSFSFLCDLFGRFWEGWTIDQGMAIFRSFKAPRPGQEEKHSVIAGWRWQGRLTSGIIWDIVCNWRFEWRNG